jgi:hypothetical protein
MGTILFMFNDIARMFENAKRARLLKFFVFQSDVRASASAAGTAIGIPAAAAEKEARALVKLGVLVSKRHGTKKPLLSLNLVHPWLPAVRAFLDETTLPSDRAIAGAFRGVGGISLIVATGVLAREERSSLDLLLVARKSKNPAIAKAVRRAESMAGLPLRYAVLEPGRYTERLEANDRLLRDVFEFSHRTIHGHP